MVCKQALHPLNFGPKIIGIIIALPTKGIKPCMLTVSTRIDQGFPSQTD